MPHLQFPRALSYTILVMSLGLLSDLADRAAYMTVFCLSTTVAVAAEGLPWFKVKTAARPEQDAFIALLTDP